jgi:spore germination cell wall hydrolase CwlJ-like protein
VAAVCLQKKQFSCWNGKKFKRASSLATKGVSRDVLDVATSLAKDLVAGNELDRRLVWFANHYHANYVMPGWARARTPTAVIGNHIFYKLKS